MLGEYWADYYTWGVGVGGGGVTEKDGCRKALLGVCRADYYLCVGPNKQLSF